MAKLETDVVVIGAGHNGLVVALLLARKGLRVHVVEDKDVVGGAVRTERPFKKAPELGISTGAYLLGLMPPELLRKLGIDIPTRRRDPHYFLPTTDNRYLMFGSDAASTKHQFIEFFSEADWRANEAMLDEIAKMRDDIAPTWLMEPVSIEQTADRYVRPELTRRSSTSAAAASARTSTASSSRAISSRRCTPRPTASPACTAPGTRPAPG